MYSREMLNSASRQYVFLTPFIFYFVTVDKSVSPGSTSEILLRFSTSVLGVTYGVSCCSKIWSLGNLLP